MDADVIIAVLVVGGAVIFAIRGLAWNKVNALGARSWPLTQGTIEFGTVIEHRTRYFSYYSAQLSYSYNVNGEYYSGFYDKFFFRESSAQKFVDALKGKPAFVRHKTSAAETSMILREDQQSVWPLQI